MRGNSKLLRLRLRSPSGALWKLLPLVGQIPSPPGRSKP